MATAKVVWQIICPTCRKGAPQGSPYCDQCGTPLNNLPAVPVEQRTEQAAQTTVPEHVLKKFLNEEQDPALVKQIYEKALRIMVEGEEIEYVATASKMAVGSSFDCVVATNRRLIDYKKRMLGKIGLDDCFWRDVRELQLKETRQGVTLIVETIQGWRLTVESLPRAQAWRLYEVGAEYNAKLRLKLQEMFTIAGVADAVEQAPGTLEEPEAEVSVPVPAHEEYAEYDLRSEADLEIVPSVEVSPASWDLSSLPRPSAAPTGPLPSLSPVMDSFPMQGWQIAPASATESSYILPEKASSAPPVLSGLDDLFSPTLEKSRPSPVQEPVKLESAPKAQPEPERVFVVEQSEPAVGKSLVGAHAVNYQAMPQHSPAGVTNGSSGNSNGSLHLLKLNEPEVSESPRISEAEPAQTHLPPAQQVTAPVRDLKRAVAPSSPASLPGNVAEEHRKVSSSHESPMRKLKQLKRMLDVGLITQDDYEIKKAEILSRF